MDRTGLPTAVAKYKVVETNWRSRVGKNGRARHFPAVLLPHQGRGFVTGLSESTPQDRERGVLNGCERIADEERWNNMARNARGQELDHDHVRLTQTQLVSNEPDRRAGLSSISLRRWINQAFREALETAGLRITGMGTPVRPAGAAVVAAA